ncbi:MAG: YgaP family membrane protein [Magnetospiraceae bacterium]
MQKNMGILDRALRAIVGVIAIAFALLSSSPYAMWGWIGVVPLATAIIAWCPAYVPFGLKTCKVESKVS